MIAQIRVSNVEPLAIELEAKGKRAGSMLESAMDDIANVMQSVARGKVHSRTGNLASAIGTEKARRAGPIGRVAKVTVDVQRAPYFVMVNDGTGVFGKRGKPIKAKPGNVFAFDIDGRTVFTRQFKGQKGQHFMEKAFEEVERTYAPARLEVLAERLADV